MKKILFLFVILLSNNTFSGEYTGKSNIAWMTSIVGDHFVISGSWNNALNCSNMNQNIWKIKSGSGSQEELQSMYSMVMAAYMAGKTIELYTHACDSGGTSGRPMARSVYMPSRTGS